MSTFNGFSAATTPVPDDLFDELLTKLTGSELRALLYLIRRSGGDPVAIPLTQFRECGLYTPTSAGRALTSLERKGCITIISKPETTLYALRYREVQG